MGEEKTTQTILVVGGGISGTTTAIEAAEAEIGRASCRERV